MRSNLSRRALIAGFAAATAAMAANRAGAAQTFPKMTVSKDPSCGCCGAWVDYLRSAGFEIEVVEASDMNRVKARLGVPKALASCHTAEIGGYVIEGHVPAPAIKRLLTEKPQAKGISVPGMPVGSPGMEVEGMEAETYEVILFGPSDQRVFARFKGSAEI